MSVAYILSQAGVKMGLNPADSNERPVLIRFLNEAVDELYAQADPAGSLMEACFKVNGDQTIALPSYVGPVRGMREYNSMIPWSITKMQPRYYQSNWNDFWRTFRIIGKRALQKTITNQGPVTLTVAAVESPAIVVIITGSTQNAASITESVTLSSTSVQSVNNFTDITALNKSAVNNYDITVSDLDGNALAVIPNNEKSSTYQILDVSTCPWLPTSNSTLEHYMEIMFKKKLPYLTNDGDEFPAQGYDNIVVNKILQLWFEEQGKADIAAAYDAKATRSMARKHEEENRSTQDCVALVENPHDSLTPRVRSRRPYVYGGYSTGSRYGSV
jgi:hypothetical protein